MATEQELPEGSEAVPEPAPAGAGGGDDAEMPDAAAPLGSDSDDEGAAAAAELRIQALEKTLQEQPLDYETHVQVCFTLPPSCSSCARQIVAKDGEVTRVKRM